MLKSCRRINGYALYIWEIKGKNVVSNVTNYVYCKKIREEIIELLYKVAVFRGAEQYEIMARESKIALNDSIKMYRVITWAYEH